MGGGGKNDGGDAQTTRPLHVPLLTALRDEASTPANRTLVEEIWRGGSWRVFPLLLILGATVAMIMPGLPTSCVAYFAGEPCVGSQAPGGASKACENAHWQCTQFQSFWQLVTHSVLGAVLLPLTGKLSDVYGRRPFIIIGTALAALPIYLFFAMEQGWVSYGLLYPFLCIGAAFGPFSPCLAYVTDTSSKRFRTQIMGMILGEAFLGILIGPIIEKISPEVTDKAACALATLGLIYAATIPEPQAERARRAVSFKRQRVALRRTRSFKQIASLGRSSHFILLASIACIGSMIAEGLQEVSAQFFQLEVGFTMDDQATLMIVIGASGLVMQMVLLPLVMAACEGRERFILIATSALLAIINTLLACFSHHHKGLAMGLQGLAMIGLVTFTVTSGILSKAVSEKHQGLLTGVLAALRSQAMGVGPVIYAQIFKLFTQRDGAFPFFPGAPYVFTSGLDFVQIALIAMLRPEATIAIAEDGDDDDRNDADGFQFT